MRRDFAFILCVGFAFLITQSASWADFPQPMLTSVFPPTLESGKPAEVKISGQDLDEVEQLIFSVPGISATPKKNPADDFHPQEWTEPNTFTVNVAGNVAPGLYEVRAWGRFGLSGPRTISIVGKEVIPEPDNNQKIEEPAPIELDKVVCGQADNGGVDYYSVEISTGQPVLLECLGRSLDSAINPLVVVMDSEGKEIDRSTFASSGDVRLAFRPPTSGKYTIAISDFTYAGGTGYTYQFSITKKPYIEYAFPPSIQPGTAAKVTLYGYNLPGGKPDPSIKIDGRALESQEVQINAPARNDELPVSAGTPVFTGDNAGFLYTLDSPDGKSNPILVSFAEANVVIEADNNDDPSSAQPITLGTEIVGQTFPARDRDWFSLELEAGQVVWIDIYAHRLGAPVDPYIWVERVTVDAEGNEQASKVADADDQPTRAASIGTPHDTSTDDAGLTFTANDAGKYRILVQDLLGSRTDPRSVYRLVVRQPTPDFRLVATVPPQVPQNNQLQPGSLVLRKGGSAKLKVDVLRKEGFDGEVEITVQNLPGGVTCEPAIVSGDVSDAWLVLQAAENVGKTAQPISIIGTADIGGRQQRNARIGTTVVGTTNANNDGVETRLIGQVYVSIVDKETAPATVAPAAERMVETCRGANVEIPVKLQRQGGFNEAVKLTVTNLPREANPKEVNIAAGQGDGKIELTLNNANLKAGVYTFHLESQMKVAKYERNPDAIAAAETRQKELDDLIKKFTEEQKTAQTQRDDANRQAQEAENAFNTAKQKMEAAQNKLKQAQDQEKNAPEDQKQAKADAVKQAQTELDAAQKEFADAEKAKTETAAAKTTMEEAFQAAEAKTKQAQDIKRNFDNDVNNIKKENQAKDITVGVYSTPFVLKVAEHPLKVTLPGQANVKAGEETQFDIKVERLYGYEDKVDFQLTLPNGTKGISPQNAAADKGKDTGTLVVKTGKDASTGKLECELVARGRYNNVPVETKLPFVLEVAAPDPEPAK